MPRHTLLDGIAALMFALGLASFAFCYGLLVGKYRIAPYDFMAQAEGVLRGFWTANFSKLDFVNKAEYDFVGARTHKVIEVSPGFTFMTLFDGERFSGRLVDITGRILHEWRLSFSEAFSATPHISWRAPDNKIAWHGAHLFPNGDLLFNFQDGNFPYAGGLAKIDKNSNLIWSLPRNTHHDISVTEDGTIWVPSLRYRDQSLPDLPHLRPWFYEDMILKISSDGKILDELSVLEALRGVPGLLTTNYQGPLDIVSIDPTHTNNVEPLPAALADRFPMFKPGDLLVSMRNISALAVIDPETKLAKWTMVGPFVRQHDPDFLPNGRILVYDNRGNLPRRADCGASRMLEVDPATQAITWRYEGCDSATFTESGPG